MKNQKQKSKETQNEETHSDRTELLEDENRLLRNILDKLHEAVQYVDIDKKTLIYNNALEQLEGMKREDIIGKKITDVYDYSQEFNLNSSPLLNALEKKDKTTERHIKYTSPNGKKVDVLSSSYPYYKDDVIVGAFSICQDVSKWLVMFKENRHLRNILNFDTSKNVIKNGTVFKFEDIVGKSKSLNDTIMIAKKYANKKAHILICGETGTGKELFAQSIHNSSEFSNGNFVSVNCAAIPDSLMESILFGTKKGAFTGAEDTVGLIEQAENGTLYLDELNSMNINMQSKLLRVLQDKEVRRVGDNNTRKINCRVVSSINVEPSKALENNEIRQDLYYRISAATIFVPPLRERSEDVELLTEFFINRYNKEFSTSYTGASPTLIAILNNYTWPGNVRELENVLESSLSLMDSEYGLLNEKYLPQYITKNDSNTKSNNVDDYISKFELSEKVGLNELVSEIETRIITEALRNNNNNISKTAEELKIIRQTLYYKIEKYGIIIDKKV